MRKLLGHRNSGRKHTLEEKPKNSFFNFFATLRMTTRADRANPESMHRVSWRNYTAALLFFFILTGTRVALAETKEDSSVQKNTRRLVSFESTLSDMQSRLEERTSSLNIPESSSNIFVSKETRKNVETPVVSAVPAAAVKKQSNPFEALEKEKPTKEGAKEAAPVKKMKFTMQARDLNDRKYEFHSKTMQGRLSAISFNGMEVEFGSAGDRALWFNFMSGLKVSGVKSLSDLEVGDLLKVDYNESLGKEKRVLSAIHFIGRPPKEPELNEEEAMVQTPPKLLNPAAKLNGK